MVMTQDLSLRNSVDTNIYTQKITLQWVRRAVRTKSADVHTEEEAGTSGDGKGQSDQRGFPRHPSPALQGR